MVRNDSWIAEKALQGMIDPFAENQVRKGVISYGVSSYGYDIRVASRYKIFTGANASIVDPKAFDESAFEDFEGDACVIPPHSFALGRSFEYIRVPRELIVLCTGKSTYARCGILVNITPLEPEWEGFITIAISNTTPLPCKVYSGEGIAQLVFLASDTPCSCSYKDKAGKYQKQTGIGLPRVS